MPSLDYLERLTKELASQLPASIVREAIQRARSAAGGAAYPPKPEDASLTEKLAITEITPHALRELDKDDLLLLHKRVHELYKLKTAKLSKEVLVNAHVFIKRELLRRGLEHPELDDGLDDESLPLEKAEGEPILLIENFISLVGSAVNGHREPHDLDILVRVDKHKITKDFLNPSFWVALRKVLDPLKEKELHIIHDEQGPHDDFRPLYHLALIPASATLHHVGKAERIEPLRFFAPWKTRGGLDRFEFDSDDPDLAWERWGKRFADEGVIVQEKYDGFRVLLHKQGQEIRLYTEEGRRDLFALGISPLEDLEDELRSLPDIILDGELELYAKEPIKLSFEYKRGEKIERMDMPSFLKRDPVADFEPRIFVFDILYLKGEDLSHRPYRERLEILEEVLEGRKGQLFVAPSCIVKTAGEFAAAVRHFSRQPGSEGAIAKAAGAPYSTGPSSTLIKLKNYKELIVRVKDKERTKAGTFVYTAALKDGTVIGRTLATKLDVPVGTKLEVRVAEVKVRPDGKVTWDNPIVVGKKGFGFAVTSLERARELARMRRQAMVIKAGGEVPPEGPRTAKLAIVGDGPGRIEEREGRPLVGPSGQFLRRLIRELGADSNDILWANIYSRRVDVVEPERTRELGEKLLAKLSAMPNLKVVLAISAIAVQGLLGERGRISDLRGRVWETDGLKVLATYHPSAILRTGQRRSRYYRRFREDVREALALAGLVSQVEKRQLFGSQGGKGHVAGKLAEMIPPHRVYVEPYAGGAALFFRKEPSDIEVLADIDGEVIQAYKDAQALTDEEIRELQKKDWILKEEHFQELKRSKPSSRVDRLYKFLYTIHGAYNFKRQALHANPNSIGKRITIADSLPEIRERLQGVHLLHADARKVIEKFDSPDTFFYLDPPYPGKWVGDFPGEGLTPAEFDRLVALIKRLKGKVMLSISSDYCSRLPKEFTIKRITVPVSIALPGTRSASGRRVLERKNKVELVALNYSSPSKSLPTASDVHVPQLLQAEATVRLQLLGVGAMDSPRFKPAGLFIETGESRVMIDGGRNSQGMAAPPGNLNAWLVTDKQGELMGVLRRLAQERGVEPEVASFQDSFVKITPKPVEHTSHPTFGYLIEASGKKIVWAPEFSKFPDWAEEADLMFSEASSWERPIRFAGGRGGHLDVLTVAERAKQKGVKRLVFAHIGRPTIEHLEKGDRPPFGEFGHDDQTFLLT